MPPVVEVYRGLAAVAQHALGVIVSLAAVLPLREVLLDAGAPVVLLHNCVSGSKASRRRRVTRRDPSSYHDPTSTSSDEEDAGWEDEDGDGVSARRLRFGSELALLQLVDMRRVGQAPGGPVAPPVPAVTAEPESPAKPLSKKEAKAAAKAAAKAGPPPPVAPPSPAPDATPLPEQELDSVLSGPAGGRRPKLRVAQLKLLELNQARARCCLAA